MPEANAIGVQRRHAVIAPAAGGGGLAPGAAEQYSFSLPEVIQWVAGKTPGITDRWEIVRAGRGIADGRVAILIHGYRRHPAE